MLVLSRRIGEAIMIGKDIKVVVVDIRGDKVRIGIDADRTIDIHRDDIIQTQPKNESNDK